jgi:hypothetical protein
LTSPPRSQSITTRFRPRALAGRTLGKHARRSASGPGNHAPCPQPVHVLATVTYEAGLPGGRTDWGCVWPLIRPRTVAHLPVQRCEQDVAVGNKASLGTFCLVPVDIIYPKETLVQSSMPQHQDLSDFVLMLHQPKDNEFALISSLRVCLVKIF